MPGTVQDSLAYFNQQFPTAASDPFSALPTDKPDAYVGSQNVFTKPVPVLPANQHVGQSIEYFNQVRNGDIDNWMHQTAAKEIDNRQGANDPYYERHLAEQFNSAFPGSDFNQVKPYLDQVRAAHQKVDRMQNFSPGPLDAGSPSWQITNGVEQKAQSFHPTDDQKQFAAKFWNKPADKLTPDEIANAQQLAAGNQQAAIDQVAKNPLMKLPGLRHLATAGAGIAADVEALNPLNPLSNVLPHVGPSQDDLNRGLELVNQTRSALDAKAGIPEWMGSLGVELPKLAGELALTGRVGEIGGLAEKSKALLNAAFFGNAGYSQKLTQYRDSGLSEPAAHIAAIGSGIVQGAAVLGFEGVNLPGSFGKAQELATSPVVRSGIQKLAEGAGRFGTEVLGNMGIMGAQTVGQAAIDAMATGRASYLDANNLFGSLIDNAIQATLLPVAMHGFGAARESAGKLLENYRDWRAKGNAGVPPESVLPKDQLERVAPATDKPRWFDENEVRRWASANPEAAKQELAGRDATGRLPGDKQAPTQRQQLFTKWVNDELGRLPGLPADQPGEHNGNDPSSAAAGPLHPGEPPATPQAPAAGSPVEQPAAGTESPPPGPAPSPPASSGLKQATEEVPFMRNEEQPAAGEKPFSLSNKPQPTASGKGSFENADATRQGKLFSGLDALPGQKDLFGDLDKPEAMSSGEQDAAQAAAIRRNGLRPTGDPPSDAIRAAPFKVIDDFRKIFNPQARSSQAMLAGEIIRHRMGELDQANRSAETMAREARRAFDKLPESDRLDFIYRMEEGRKQSTSERDRFAGTLRTMLDDATRRVQDLGTGKLQQAIEDYFPHLWDDPQKAGKVIAQINARRPIEGPGGFLKRRSIMTTREGIEQHGLSPVSSNPADLVLLKLREMNHYYAGQKIAQDLASNGLKDYVPVFGKARDGYARLDGKVFTHFGPPELAVTEAYDHGMMEGLTDFARKLGVEHERKMSLKPPFGNPKGTIWGLAYGDKKVETRFAGPISALAHEITHTMDKRYGMADALGFNSNDPTIARERENISNLRTELDDARGITRSQNFKDYLRRPAEQMAMLGEGYIHAQDRIKQVAPTLFKRFDEFLQSHPELEDFRNIKPTLTMAENKGAVRVPGLTIVGHDWAPEPVARVYNNFLSPGLRGNAIYDGARGFGNVATMAQLGLSYFHAMTTAINSALSHASLGLRQAGRGVIGKGLLSFAKGATFLPAVASDYSQGRQIREAYRQQFDKITDPTTKQMVESYMLAGGRIDQDRMYINNAAGNMRKAIQDFGKSDLAGKVWNALKIGGNAPFAAIEGISWPLLSHFVPTMKAGAFGHLALDELSRLPDNASYGERRAALQRGWDSIDNRFGQLVYDNLFWNRSVKDALMATVRSLGWNLGTLREFVGAGADVLKAPGRIQAGDQLVSHRMAYAMAAPLLVGTWGAMTQYLLSGKPPQSPKDCFFPRTGKIRPDGTEDRISLPSYMRDIYGFLTHPLETIGHKANPLVSSSIEALNNQDFYGNQIYDPSNPAPGLAKYAAKSFLPFSVRNFQQMRESGVSPGAAIASFAGITPAPAEIVRSPALNKAVEYYRETLPRVREVGQAEAGQQRRDLIDGALQAGGTAELKKRLDAEVAAGRMTPRQSADTLKRAGQQPLVRYVSGQDFTPEHALDVWKLADSKERTPEFNAAVEKKVASALASHAPQAASDLYDRAKDSGFDMTGLRAQYVGRLAYAATGELAARKVGETDEKYQTRKAAHEAGVQQAQAKLKELGASFDEARQQLPLEYKRRGFKTDSVKFRERLNRLPKLATAR